MQARSFAELLEQAIRKYQNRAIETAQVIEELIQLAKDMRAAEARGEDLGLIGRRARVLRRARDERQRGQGARRRDAAHDRARARRDGAQERDDRLDDPRQRARAPAKDWALFNGISVDYELPKGGSHRPRHQDLSIQTLLFPQELETRVRTMSQLARTAIEESGANILYLAFGFLEWRESDDSDEVSLAPLLLLPVSLRKEKKDRGPASQEKYVLEYSGEDLQANLSLRERLHKDFALVLPELDDEDSPEDYFRRCQPLLVEHPILQLEPRGHLLGRPVQAQLAGHNVAQRAVQSKHAGFWTQPRLPRHLVGVGGAV